METEGRLWQSSAYTSFSDLEKMSQERGERLGGGVKNRKCEFEGGEGCLLAAAGGAAAGAPGGDSRSRSAP